MEMANRKMVLFNLKLKGDLYMITGSEREQLGIFLDLSCDRGISILKNSSEGFQLSSPYHWLLWDDSLEKTLTILEELNLSIDSDVTLAIGSNEILFFDVYKIYYTTSVIVSNIGTWSHSTGIFNMTDPPQRNDFRGFIMNTTYALPDPKFVEKHSIEYILDHNNEAHIHPLLRLYIRDFMNLKEMLNMTYNYKVTDGWGRMNASGEFDGTIGEMSLGHSEISFAETAFRKDRSTKIDYVHHISLERIIMVFLQPHTLGSYKALAAPFSLDVWLLFGLIIFGTLAVYRLLAFFGLHGKLKTLSDSVEQTFSIVSQQGGEDFENYSTRYVSFVFLMGYFILYNYYNAGILNGLLTPSPSTINSMDDLLKSSLSILLHDAPYSKDRSADSIFGPDNDMKFRLLEKISKEEHKLYSTHEGLLKVKTGKYAFTTSEFTMYDNLKSLFTEQQICESDNILLSVVLVGFTTRKRSPFKEILGRKFKLMDERGLLLRSRRAWYASKPECNWRNEAVSISSESLTLAYFVLFIGMSLSFNLFLVELCRFKKLKK